MRTCIGTCPEMHYLRYLVPSAKWWTSVHRNWRAWCLTLVLFSQCTSVVRTRCLTSTVIWQSSTSIFRILLVFITWVYTVINLTFLPFQTNPQSRQINSRELLHEFLREFPKDAEKHVYLQWKICSRRFASVNCYFFPFRFCKNTNYSRWSCQSRFRWKIHKKLSDCFLWSRGASNGFIVPEIYPIPSNSWIHVLALYSLRLWNTDNVRLPRTKVLSL